MLTQTPGKLRIALVRHHDLCLNSRQIAEIQRRAGILPHLGLSYIQAALEGEGHEVTQIDTPALGMDTAGLRNLLISMKPDLVGVTTTTPGLPGALEACQAGKDSGALVILGGPHTEAFGVENLQHACIDFVGVGEGISIMKNLAAALVEGRSPDGIRGLISRSASGGAAPMLNLSDVRWPARHGLPLDKYFSIMARRPFTTMISSRGCPFQCSFCFKQAVDRKSMYRTAEDVVDEMEYLEKEWGIREIMFYDDVFTLHRKRVAEICQLYRRRKLKVLWEAPTRVDLVPTDLLREMAASGCRRLRFGIEHGDPEILERMKKESNIGRIEDAVRGAHKAGIQTFGYFIVGWLHETREQFERTIELACRLPFTYASFYTATPLPGTTLHREAVECGAIPGDYWQNFVSGDFDSRIPSLVSDAQLRSREAYRRFYLRPKMAGPLMRHVMATKQLSNTFSGLFSLARSSSNSVRDY